jgi:hypothetical protein
MLFHRIGYMRVKEKREDLLTSLVVETPRQRLLRIMLKLKQIYEPSMSSFPRVMRRRSCHVRFVRRLLSQNSLRMTKNGCGRTPLGKMIEYVLPFSVAGCYISCFIRFIMQLVMQKPLLLRVASQLGYVVRKRMAVGLPLLRFIQWQVYSQGLE